jgi:hypothetical protein
MTLADDKAHFLELSQYYFPIGARTKDIANRAQLYLGGLTDFLPRAIERMMTIRFLYEAIPFDELKHPDFEPLFQARSYLELIEGATSAFLQEPSVDMYEILDYLCVSFIIKGNIYRKTINTLGRKIHEEDRSFIFEKHEPIINIRKPGRFIRRGSI